jgi:hypothetical protein
MGSLLLGTLIFKLISSAIKTSQKTARAASAVPAAVKKNRSLSCNRLSLKPHQKPSSGSRSKTFMNNRKK